MDVLLGIKYQLTRFYSRFEAFIVPVLKFLLALIMLLMINGHVGYMTKLKNPAIVLIISLLCSFMPTNIMVLVAGFVILGHVYSLSMECAIVLLMVFMIMYALYFRFTPKDAVAAILTPICFCLKIPYVVVFGMGFVGNPLSALSVGCGTAVYYMLSYIEDNERKLESSGSFDTESALSSFKTIIDGLLKNQDMIVMIVTFAVIIVLINLIRRLKFNYSWHLALVAGVIIGYITLLIVNGVLDGDVGLGGAFFSMLISSLFTIILIFFIFMVDYSRAQNVQFEDDDYYYYVKAIPKLHAQRSESSRGRKRRPARRQEAWDEEDDYDDEYDEDDY